MEMVPVLVIAVVLLVGLVTLALGFRGWHPANIAASLLVLLSSCGFIALAGIRGQSERAWTGLLRSWESKVLEARDAVRVDPKGKPGVQRIGDCSIETLQNCTIAELQKKQREWSRALERVSLWRGRYWPDVAFVPPDGDKTGRITIPAPENPSIAEGAAVHLFDGRPLADGGRYIGGFRVVKVEQNQLEILPLGRVDARDRDAWKAPHEQVVAYENLPFDRWIAFHRTGRDAEETVIPEPTKQVPDVPERSGLRESVERHDFPERLLGAVSSEDNPLPEDPDAVPPGVQWASVEFEADFEWKPEGSDGRPEDETLRFEAGERVSAFPARDVAPLRKAGAKFKHQWSMPPGLYWAKVEFTDDYSVERGDADPLVFSSGAVAHLPLEFARNLEKDGKVKVTRIFHRRQLTAPETALQGASVVDRSGRPAGSDAKDGDSRDGITLDSQGIYRLSDVLEGRIIDLGRNKDAVEAARKAATSQLEALGKVRDRLEKDLENWSGDVASAERLEREAAKKHEAIQKSLESSERSIVELAARLRKITGVLATEIERRAPPPAPAPSPGS